MNNKKQITIHTAHQLWAALGRCLARFTHRNAIAPMMFTIGTFTGSFATAASTIGTEVPGTVSFNVKVRCEALTDQKIKYLVFLDLVKNLEPPGDILNSLLTPGAYGEFKLTAVPYQAGNRSDDAIMEKFDKASVVDVDASVGNQVFANYKNVTRLAIKQVDVSLHFSKHTNLHDLKVLGITYKKVYIGDFHNAPPVVTEKNSTFIESTCTVQ